MFGYIIGAFVGIVIFSIGAAVSIRLTDKLSKDFPIFKHIRNEWFGIHDSER